MADSPENPTPLKKQSAADQFVFFKGLARLGLYLALGLVLFFAASVLVLSLRQRAPQESTMQEVVGKYYLDVHNELAREQLRVELGSRSFTDLPAGQILYQSISAGSKIRPRDQLYLVVNQPTPLFAMPHFIGNSLSSAQAALGRMTHKQKVFTIEIGSVARIKDDAPKDIILEQSPPAGAELTIRSKVHLLVSAGPAAAGLPKQTAAEAINGMNIAVAGDYLRRSGLDYRIAKIEPAQRAENAGLVSNITQPPDGPLQLTVAFSEPPARFQRGYEMLNLTLEGEPPCEVSARPIREDQAAAPERVIFRTAKFAKDEKVSVLFFRQGSEKVRLQCGGKELLEKKLRPDNFG